MPTQLLTVLLGQALGGGSDKKVEEIKQEKDYTDIILVALLVIFLLSAGIGIYFISTKKG